jgi:hypothetical protein
MRYKLFNCLFFIGAIALASCSKTFLTQPVPGQLDEAQNFNDSAGLAAFVNGVFPNFANANFIGGEYEKINELMADEIVNNNGAFSPDDQAFYARNTSYFGGSILNVYQQGYLVVHSSNLILNHLAVAGANANFFAGEAFFFRGVSNFDLVRLFAQPYGYTSDNSHLGIPLRVTTSLDPMQRATVSQNYAEIISDLQEADTLLPSSPLDGKYYTATKWAAEAFLAKVYFQMNDFADAYKYSTQVINSNLFQLDSNYSNRFSVGLSNEAILRIATNSSSFLPGSSVQGYWRSDLAIPYFFFTNTFYQFATSNPNDIRDTAVFSTTLQPGHNVLRKYNKTYLDYTVVHLTDMKLICAEAGAEIAGTTPAALPVAISNLNDILNRASGYTGSMNITTGSTPAFVIATARAQHEIEMAGEGDRLQEIKRIGALDGTNVDRRGSPWNCPGFVLQFPELEVAAEPGFVQNPVGDCNPLY